MDGGILVAVLIAATPPVVRGQLSADGAGLVFDTVLPASTPFALKVDPGAEPNERIQVRAFVWPSGGAECTQAAYQARIEKDERQSYELAMVPESTGASPVLHVAQVPALEANVDFCVRVVRERALRDKEVEAFLDASSPQRVAALSTFEETLEVPPDERLRQITRGFEGQVELVDETLGASADDGAVLDALRWGTRRFMASEPARALETATRTWALRVQDRAELTRRIGATDDALAGQSEAIQGLAAERFAQGTKPPAARVHVWLDEAWTPLAALTKDKAAAHPTTYDLAAAQLAALEETAASKGWRAALAEIGATADAAARKKLVKALRKRAALSGAPVFVTCGGAWKRLSQVFLPADQERPSCSADEYVTIAKQLALLQADPGTLELVRQRAALQRRSVALTKAFADAQAAYDEAKVKADTQLRQAMKDALLELRIDQANVRSDRSGHGATANVGNYASLDAGFALAVPFQSGDPVDALPLPYIGLNINFAPAEREVPLEQLVNGTSQRLSLTVGLSLTNQTVEKALGDLGPAASTGGVATAQTFGTRIKPLFGSTYPLIGLGWRLAHFVRVTGGMVFYWVEDKNPALDRRAFSAAPFAAISLDLDVIKFASKQLGEL